MTSSASYLVLSGNFLIGICLHGLFAIQLCCVSMFDMWHLSYSLILKPWRIWENEKLLTMSSFHTFFISKYFQSNIIAWCWKSLSLCKRTLCYDRCKLKLDCICSRSKICSPWLWILTYAWRYQRADCTASVEWRWERPLVAASLPRKIANQQKHKINEPLYRARSRIMRWCLKAAKRALFAHILVV